MEAQDISDVGATTASAGKRWIVWAQHPGTQQIFKHILQKKQQLVQIPDLGKQIPASLTETQWDHVLIECETAAEANAFLGQFSWQGKHVLLLLPAPPPAEEIMAWIHRGIADVLWPLPDWQSAFEERWLLGKRRFEPTPDANLGPFVQELAQLNEDFFHRLTKMARDLGEMRDKMQPVSAEEQEKNPPDVLIVEDQFWLSSAIAPSMQNQMSFYHAAGGGVALDMAAQRGYQLVCVDLALSDLPAKTVAKSILEQCPDALLVLFEKPAALPGKLVLFDHNAERSLIPAVSNPIQILQQFPDLIEIQRRRNRERRYLVSFRQEHYELLRRYRDIRQKLRTHGSLS